MATCYRFNYHPVQHRQAHPAAGFLSQFNSVFGEIERALAQQQQEQRSVRTVHPKFDVKETETAFEIYGELPGYSKDNINIQWNEDNLTISGQTQKEVETAPAEAEVAETAAQENIDDSASESSGYQKPTVEDDGEDGFETVEKPADQSSEKAAADTVATTSEKKTVSKPAPNHRYWISERSYGKFSRTFPFARHVDHDNLTAKLADGVLTIVVPKTKAPEPRRVYIN
jgi:HSP20 family protein